MTKQLSSFSKWSICNVYYASAHRHKLFMIRMRFNSIQFKLIDWLIDGILNTLIHIEHDQCGRCGSLSTDESIDKQISCNVLLIVCFAMVCRIFLAVISDFPTHHSFASACNALAAWMAATATDQQTNQQLERSIEFTCRFNGYAWLRLAWDGIENKCVYVCK